VLLSGIAMVCIAACVLLGLMAWEAPRMVMAAFAPTQTFTPTYTMMPTHTAAPTSTTTPTPVATWTLQPTSTPTDTPAPTRVAADVSSGSPSLSTDLGAKWLLIDLSDQRLTAYEGETPMLTALVSTGIARYPTPPGDYTIIRQVRRQVMSGPGYYLPNVEYVSYFYRGYAIHGTYWHSNFGNPMSHGCVNMTNQDASWIYDWAPIGTPVQVRP
jgi:lipoprotein-anchoring transpeptidase ErfK/SrfK